MSTITDAARGVFAERFPGRAPAGVWSAPGRANLIGEHTDYNGGYVLPFAIDKRTAVAVAANGTERFRITSTLFPEIVEASIQEAIAGGAPKWALYAIGIAAVLAESHPDAVTGLDIAIASEVPLGSGLSSSAALECAVAIALNDLFGLGLGRMDLARAGQRNENTIVGAPTGIMDQAASLGGRADSALFLDCRSLETEIVPLGLDAAGLGILIANTREEHSHASNGYAARRASCERAAAVLGVPLLRDATLADLDAAASRLDEETFLRARHVVTEDARVLETVDLLRSSGPDAIGPLLTASHVSLRDDFAVTTDRLDTAVESALGAGAIGARMTGGGFGGCAIALVPSESLANASAAITEAFAEKGYGAPDVFTAVPSDGARRDA